MTKIGSDHFKGEPPRLDPHLLPEGYAQTSTNGKPAQSDEKPLIKRFEPDEGLGALHKIRSEEGNTDE
jgi:hypothetical protein